MNSDNHQTVTCHTCGADVLRQKAFYILEFSFCSIKCTEFIRKQLQDKERKLEEEKNSKHSRHGAFSLNYGNAF